MTEETVGSLIQRAKAGDTLTPEEAARVQEWVRADLVPAVQRLQVAIVAGLKPAFERVAVAFNSPEGRQLVAIAQEWEARKHADRESQ